jgi:hypothetical protein
LVAKLLAEGADPDAPGPLGCTPLALAAASGQPALVQALLSAGADMERLSMEKLPRDFVLMSELPRSGEGIARNECLRLFGATGKIPSRHKPIGPKDGVLIDWIKGARTPGSPIPPRDDGYGRTHIALDFASLKRYKGSVGMPKAMLKALKSDNWQNARFEPEPADESFAYSWTEYSNHDSWEKIACSVYVAVSTVASPGGDFSTGEKVARLGFAEGDWIRIVELSRDRMRHFPQGDAKELRSFVSGVCRPSDAGRQGTEYLGSLMVLANHAWGGFDWALSTEKQERAALEKNTKTQAAHVSKPRI